MSAIDAAQTMRGVMISVAQATVRVAYFTHTPLACLRTGSQALRAFNTPTSAVGRASASSP